MEILQRGASERFGAPLTWLVHPYLSYRILLIGVCFQIIFRQEQAWTRVLALSFPRHEPPNTIRYAPILPYCV